ncbi:Kae1-associated serine/threonine protein kinase [Candidatus Pacearchaeota archaeon]|nr:Kae1-associated serine/threonine protein kinase [Candidatus Pacearchaeota archaeon]
MKKLLFHAAEAKIYKTKEGILKERSVKSYRHPHLDLKLRKTRTKTEARLLIKAKQAGIPVPHLKQQTETTLLLEEVKGKKLADTLDKATNKQTLVKQLGTLIAQLHNAHLIHGDLTTSNIMIHEKKKDTKTNLVLIDFGLGYESARAEDKATDLHVFKEALEAKHYQDATKLWTAFLTSYTKTIKDTRVLERLTAVEKRGRYKQQF